jgi:hypothetical protein
MRLTSQWGQPGPKNRVLLLALFSLALVWPVLFAPAAFAQELSPQDQQKLAALQSGLQRVQTNLELAQQSAGAGTPTGSKAKLSKMRLDSAAVDVPQLKQLLAELPAADPQVAQAASALAQTEQAIQELDDRLSGKNAPPPAATSAPADTPAPVAPAASSAPPAAASPPDAAPSPVVVPAPAAAAEPAADQPMRLGYQQEEVLKGARFNLREVSGGVAKLNEEVAGYQAVADQNKVSYRAVKGSLATLENARRKAGFTQDALDKLPPNGAGVAETAAELAAANRELDAAEAYLAPLDQQLSRLIDPANYPDLQADLDRMRELSVMYNNPMILQTNREQAAAVMEQAPAAREEAIRIATTYLPLIEQRTEEGKRVEGAGNAFLQNLEKFKTAAEQTRQQLPGEIRADLAEANQVAEAAVAEQKPLFFTGGIPQSMGFAREKLALYEMLDPGQAPALAKEVQAMQASLDQREKSLAELIIQQNPLPSDRYTGGDRDQVVAVAVDAWKHQQKDFEVLASRIPSEVWSRETLWQYSNGTWYYVDRSRLQVQLLVADEKNDSLAKILPINIWKDHQKGDAMIGTPIFSGDEVLQPSSYLLREKIR